MPQEFYAWSTGKQVLPASDKGFAIRRLIHRQKKIKTAGEFLPCCANSSARRGNAETQGTQSIAQPEKRNPAFPAQKLFTLLYVSPRPSRLAFHFHQSGFS
jgi:hypothetical protein